MTDYSKTRFDGRLLLLVQIKKLLGSSYYLWLVLLLLLLSVYWVLLDRSSIKIIFTLFLIT